MEQPTEEVPFNFDLERMKKAVESPSIMLPTGLTSEQLCEWLNLQTTKSKGESND